MQHLYSSEFAGQKPEEELGLAHMGCEPFPEAKKTLPSMSDLTSRAFGSWEVSQLLPQMETSGGEL